MQVQSTRFGEIEIDDSLVINMVKGILGFDEMSQFCLVKHRSDTSFIWLQSTQEPGLAFVMINPLDVFSSYDFEIPDADAEKLQISTQEDANVLAMVRIGNSGQDITVNLAAPIVINKNNMNAIQVVLQDSKYSIKQPITPLQNDRNERILNAA